MLCLSYFVYTLSSTTLEIRAKQILPESKEGWGEGGGERNCPNKVCTYE
jgi:hypothetical protein